MIRFSAVNRVDSLHYSPLFQRHHLIPLQVASVPELASTFRSTTADRFCFDDFESNGILLPCDEKMAISSGWPLHRGPHPRYNELVIDRLMQITHLGEKIDDQDQKRDFLGFRIHLLQRGLRRGLTANGFDRLRLNRRDPARPKGNFDHIDAAVDKLYNATTGQFGAGQTDDTGC